MDFRAGIKWAIAWITRAQRKSGVLTAQSIRSLMNKGLVDYEGFSPPVDPIGAASLDIHLHKTGMVTSSATREWCLSVCIENPLGRDDYTTVKLPYVLQPGECMLARTSEHFTIPDNIAAQVGSRSSAGRLFLQVCGDAGYVDPGFEGHLTLELHNAGRVPYEVRSRSRCAQLVMWWCDDDTERSYSRVGRYFRQRGITPAR